VRWLVGLVGFLSGSHRVGISSQVMCRSLGLLCGLTLGNVFHRRVLQEIWAQLILGSRICSCECDDTVQLRISS
jgi:hypothetical protein